MSVATSAPIPPLREADVQEIVRRLAQEFSPRAVYLFGSHVHGVPHRDSDVDVLVVLDDTACERVDRAKRGYFCLRGLELPVELHFITPERFLRRSAVGGSFEYEILSTGRLIYSATGVLTTLAENSTLVSQQVRSTKIEIVQEWLRLAHGALQSARTLLEVSRDTRAAACFWAQQAVERALRAVLQWHEIRPPKGRDLTRIFDACASVGVHFDQWRRSAEGLTRYADAADDPTIPDPTDAEAKSALVTASMMLEAVETYLPVEART